jgi:HemY protein
MRRFIGFLFILVLSVWLGLQIAQDPGLAFFSYRQWSVEMPLWFAVLSLMVLLALFYFLWRLWGSMDSSFYRWGNWLRWHRKYKSYNKTNRGFLELIEGHWRKSENYLLAGVAQSNAPLINYLALAKAAHEQAAYDRRDTYLRRAHTAAPQAAIAIGLTQAQLQINQGQLEQALATLRHLYTVAPKHGLVLKLLEQLYIRLADWQSLLKLLPSLYKVKMLTSEQRVLLERKTYTELLKAAAHRPAGLAALREIWHHAPRKLQKDPLFMGCYAEQLLYYPAEIGEAVELLHQALKKSWDANFMRLYGLSVTTDSVKQLARAESWLKHYPNQALLLLTLGRLSMRCQLWGKARTYFEKSLALAPNPETYLEYGKLLEQLGDPSGAMQSYRNGNSHAVLVP